MLTNASVGRGENGLDGENGTSQRLKNVSRNTNMTSNKKVPVASVKNCWGKQQIIGKWSTGGSVE